MSRVFIGGDESGWPKVEMPSPQGFIDFWKGHKLPEFIRGDERNPKGEPTSKIVAESASYLHQCKADRSYDPLLPKLEAGETVNTNNFWACFTPWSLAYFMTGFWTANEHRLIKPYVIDQECDGAWTDMCNEMADDVKTVLEILITKEKRLGWLERDEPDLHAKLVSILSKMVRFLARRGVPLSYLIT